MKKENEIAQTDRGYVLAANRGSSLCSSVLDSDHSDLFDRILERCDSVYVLSEEEAEQLDEDRD